MNRLLPQVNGKKAVSEIVSYAILIIISVAVAGIVFAALYIYIPKGLVAQCPDGVSIVMKDYKCNGDSLEITLSNKGLFNVSLVKITLRNANRRVASVIEDPKPRVLFPPLSPGSNTQISPHGSEQLSGDYYLEIQPEIILEDGHQAVCSNSIIKQNIVC